MSRMAANDPSTAPEAPNPPSAAPTKPDKAGKGNKKPKYPTPEGGLLEYPKDFDPDKHAPLQRKDFKDETVFLTHRAEEYELRAKNIRAEIDEIKRLGPGGAKKSNRLQAVTKELDGLIALLKAQGMNVDELMEKARQQSEAAGQPA